MLLLYLYIYIYSAVIIKYGRDDYDTTERDEHFFN